MIELVVIDSINVSESEKLKFKYCMCIESISSPQTGIPIGGQFGEINNNGSSGDSGSGGLQPYGELSNRTSSMPGSGYAGEYYGNHSNETAPTSPSLSGGSMNIQNSSLPTSSCDCSQINNVQEMVPTDQSPAGEVPAEVPGADSTGTGPAGTNNNK